MDPKMTNMAIQRPAQSLKPIKKSIQRLAQGLRPIKKSIQRLAQGLRPIKKAILVPPQRQKEKKSRRRPRRNRKKRMGRLRIPLQKYSLPPLPASWQSRERNIEAQ